MATKEDDQGITSLMENTPMPGQMQIAFGCRPSFFQSLRIEGTESIVFVAEKDGRIVGAGSSTRRQVYLNGSPSYVHYLSSLRIAPEARKSVALARGYARLRTAMRPYANELILTSILSDNSEAERLLTSGRAELPLYSPLRSCFTYIIPARRLFTGTTSSDISIEVGVKSEELAVFLNTEGPKLNLFPVCSPDDFDRLSNGRFPCLHSSDFIVARYENNIVGVLGCWDISSFRQALITGYSGSLRWTRLLVNAAVRLIGGPVLPSPGSALSLMFGALPVICKNDISIFRALLDAALSETARRGRELFAISMANHCPFNSVFENVHHYVLDSQIYSVQFDSNSETVLLDERPLHFEAASL